MNKHFLRYLHIRLSMPPEMSVCLSPFVWTIKMNVRENLLFWGWTQLLKGSIYDENAPTKQMLVSHASIRARAPCSNLLLTEERWRVIKAYVIHHQRAMFSSLLTPELFSCPGDTDASLSIISPAAAPLICLLAQHSDSQTSVFFLLLFFVSNVQLCTSKLQCCL